MSPQFASKAERARQRGLHEILVHGDYTSLRCGDFASPGERHRSTRWGGKFRWEQTHHILAEYGEMNAVCVFCGRTVGSIEFSPRHSDSVKQAVAIAHGLVEYHLPFCEVASVT